MFDWDCRSSNIVHGETCPLDESNDDDGCIECLIGIMICYYNAVLQTDRKSGSAK